MQPVYKQPRIPWWVIAGIFGAAAVIAVVIAFASGTSEHHPDPSIAAHYDEWKAECIDYANGVLEFDPVYRVGGNHWVDVVNDCMVDKAVDEAP